MRTREIKIVKDPMFKVVDVVLLGLMAVSIQAMWFSVVYVDRVRDYLYIALK